MDALLSRLLANATPFFEGNLTIVARSLSSNLDG